MKSAQALTRSLVLDMIVAWRVLLLCRLGKSHPNLPASVLYTPEELAILEVYKKKHPLPDAFDPTQSPSPVITPSLSHPERDELHRPGKAPAPVSTTLTLFQANLLVAMLGGFWGRKADGHPGPDLLGRGLVELAMLVKWERLKAPLRQGQHRGKDPPSIFSLEFASDTS